MNKKLLALVACLSVAGVGSYLYGLSYAQVSNNLQDALKKYKMDKKDESKDKAQEAYNAWLEYPGRQAAKESFLKYTLEARYKDQLEELSNYPKEFKVEYAATMKPEKKKATATKTVVKASTTKAPSVEDLKKLGVWATIDPSEKNGYEKSFNDDGDGLLEAAFDDLEGKSESYKTHLLDQYKKALQYAENIKDATAVTSIKGSIEELEK